MELLEFQDLARLAREVREGSNKVDASSVGAVAELNEVGMTSKHGIDCLIAFKAFVIAILVKFDVSKTTSNLVVQSFIFDFRYTIQVGFLLFFFLVFLLKYVCLTFGYFQTFLNFIEIKRLHEMIEVGMDELVRQTAMSSES